MKLGLFGAVIAGPLIWSGVAAACLPPTPVEVARIPGETEEAYYDRLNVGSWPNSWQILLAQRPARDAGESDVDFAERIAEWQSVDSRASQAAYDRDIVRRRAASLAEETARWESSQIVLVESLGSRTRGDFAVTRFRIIDSYGLNGRDTRVTLRYRFAQTSCDFGPPEFASGTRWVMFASNGPITNANLIGYYNLQSAQDARTRSWLGGIRPDGTPLPARRR